MIEILTLSNVYRFHKYSVMFELKKLTNWKINPFFHINKIFIIFGLESSIDNEFVRTFFSIIAVISIAINLIFYIILTIMKSYDILYFSWVKKLVNVIISHKLYRDKHKQLLEQLSKEIESKDKRLSLVLSIVWLICVLIMLLLCIQYVKDEISDDVLFGNNNENRLLFTLKTLFYVLTEISGTFYAMGSALLQIAIYLQTYYIFYCMRKRHYNSLLSNSHENDFSKLRRFRADEIQMEEIYRKLNDLIGFIPFIWLLELLIRTCINIIGITKNPSDFVLKIPYLSDIIIIQLTLITVIVIVGHLNDKFNINTISSIVNKSFPPKETTDRDFELEMIRYLHELSNRLADEPKSCGLFVINSKLILSFVNAVITFSVMCFQMHLSFK